MRSATESTILVTGGNILVKAFAMLAIILLMRGFSPAEFGQIMTMISLMSILPVFMDFGSGSSFLKIFPTMKAAGFAHRKHDLFGSALLIRSVIGTILLLLGSLLSKPLAGLLLKDETGWFLIILAFLGGFFGSFFHFLQVYFQSDEQFGLLILTQLLDAVVKAGGAGIVVGILLGSSVVYGVSIYVAAPLLATLVIAWCKRRELPRPKRPSTEEMRTFGHFSFWYMVSATSIMIFMNFDYLILAAARPAEDVGYFGSAYRIGAMFFLLVQAINTVLMPYIGRINTRAAMLEFFKKTQIRTTLLSILALPVVFMGPLVIGLVAGQNYMPAVSTYYWIALDQIVQLLFTPLMAVLFGLNRPRFLAIYVLIEMGLNIAGDLLVVHRWGPDGVAAVTLFVRLLVGSVGSIHVWYGLKKQSGFLRKISDNA